MELLDRNATWLKAAEIFTVPLPGLELVPVMEVSSDLRLKVLFLVKTQLSLAKNVSISSYAAKLWISKVGYSTDSFQNCLSRTFFNNNLEFLQLRIYFSSFDFKGYIYM